MQNTFTFTFQYSPQDAALLAANDHPVPLGFAAEAGVNTYAQISLPSLLHKVHLFLCLAVFLIARGDLLPSFPGSPYCKQRKAGWSLGTRPTW